MKMFLSAVLATVLGLVAAHAGASPARKILVVLSGQNKITLKGGVIHKTGFYLNELAVPLGALMDAGYEPVIATPDGKAPTMDSNSDKASYFGGDQKAYQAAKKLVQTLSGMSNPAKLADIRRHGVAAFAGVLVPGGHAPMEDLLVDRDLGALLREFHVSHKTTALICHGPIALLSSLENPVDFTEKLARGEKAAPGNWIYRDYRMTSFSTAEEKQQEPGQDNKLGGYVRFYPDEALRAAGGQVTVAAKWKSNVVRDRELITAQNPVSDGDFAKELLAALRDQESGSANATANFAVKVCALELPAAADRKAYGLELGERLRASGSVLLGVAPDERPSGVAEVYVLVQSSGGQNFDCPALGDARHDVRMRKAASVVLPNFKDSVATFFIGQAQNAGGQEEFERRLRVHVENTRAAFETRGLVGYVFLAGNGFEVAFMSWKSQEAMKAAFASDAGKTVVAEAGSFLANVQFVSENPFQGTLQSGQLYRVN